MNVSLTPELEKLVVDQVDTGHYASVSEAIRDAIRRTFLHKTIDPEVDSPELAAFIMEGVNSPRIPHRRGDLEKIAARVRKEIRKQPR